MNTRHGAVKSAAIEKSVVVASSTEAPSWANAFALSFQRYFIRLCLSSEIVSIGQTADGPRRRWLLSRKIKPYFLSFVVPFFQTEVKFPRESADRLFAQTGDVYSQDAAGA